MFKLIFRTLMLVGVGVVGGILLSQGIGGLPHPLPIQSGPTIEQVKQLSALVTTSVDVADVQVTELRGWTGGVRVALLVKGQYLLGTDLGQGYFESIDSTKRTAVLVLPTPVATNPRLDHDRTRLYSVSTFGLWEVLPTNRVEIATVDAALREAQASLAAAAANGPVERARNQAALVLGAFFRAIGWQVTIRWSDRP